jgi:AP-2 complex subunit alpha
LRNADVELQQRAVEYLQLSSVTSTDVLATVLEEMPPFPERESSILAKLKKRRPDKLKEGLEPRESKLGGTMPTDAINTYSKPAPVSAPEPSLATTDLLGLASSPTQPNAPAAPMNNTGLLVDVLGGFGGESSTDPDPANPYNNSFGNMGGIGDGALAPVEDNYKKFIAKNSGVLYENDLLQIGVKAEFRKNLGRITLFYGNKTQSPFKGFMPEVQYNGISPDELNIQAKPVDPVIEIGVQKQQLINIECVSTFNDVPLLSIQFL